MRRRCESHRSSSEIGSGDVSVIKIICVVFCRDFIHVHINCRIASAVTRADCICW